MILPSYRLTKDERLCLRDEISLLFGEGKAFVVYPLRVIYRLDSQPRAAHCSILVSVAKKRFRRAVKRNRVKRLVREAYRLNKNDLQEVLKERGLYATIAFMMISDELPDFVAVEKAVVKSLARITQRVEDLFPLEKEELCD